MDVLSIVNQAVYLLLYMLLHCTFECLFELVDSYSFILLGDIINYAL